MNAPVARLLRLTTLDRTGGDVTLDSELGRLTLARSGDYCVLTLDASGETKAWRMDAVTLLTALGFDPAGCAEAFARGLHR